MSQAALIGLDTSFVLRLLVFEPEAQAKAAVAELDRMREAGQKGAISDMVVAEVYFALSTTMKCPSKRL